MIFNLQKKTWVLILGASAFWLAFILQFGSYHLTLSPGWRDQVSNLYATWIFWDKGLDIYSRPTGDFLSPINAEDSKHLQQETGLPDYDFRTYSFDGQTKPVFIVWPPTPRPYPPGLYLYLAPTALAMKAGFLTLRQTIAITDFVWLVVAHLAFVIFLRQLRSMLPIAGSWRNFWVSLVGIFAYFEIMRWTLNSEYDMISVLCLFIACIAYQNKRNFLSLCALSAALFMHLRAMFYFPLAIFAFAHWSDGFKPATIRQRIRELSIGHWIAIVAGLTSTGLAVLVLHGNSAYFKMANLWDRNSLHVSHLGENWPKTLLLVAGLSAIGAYWWKRHLYPALACTLMACALMMQSRLIQEWYVLFLWPIFLLAFGEDKNKRTYDLVAMLAIYTLLAALFMNNSPFELRFVRETYQVLFPEIVH